MLEIKQRFILSCGEYVLTRWVWKDVSKSYYLESKITFSSKEEAYKDYRQVVQPFATSEKECSQE